MECTSPTPQMTLILITLPGKGPRASLPSASKVIPYHHSTVTHCHSTAYVFLDEYVFINTSP